MPKHIRPWLRAIEGPGSGGSAGNSGGEPAGGNGGTEGADTGGDKGAGDGKSGDRGSGDGGKGGDGGKSGEGEPPAQKNTPPAQPAPKSTPELKQSEPAPKPNQAGEKADDGDSAEVAALKVELAEMKEALGTLTEAHKKDAEEKQAKLAADVAKKAGLPESMADRLQGDTQEQLEADAKKLAQVLGSRVVDPTQGAGAGNGGRPTSMADAIKAKIAAAGLK